MQASGRFQFIRRLPARSWRSASHLAATFLFLIARWLKMTDVVNVSIWAPVDVKDGQFEHIRLRCCAKALFWNGWRMWWNICVADVWVKCRFTLWSAKSHTAPNARCHLLWADDSLLFRTLVHAGVLVFFPFFFFMRRPQSQSSFAPKIWTGNREEDETQRKRRNRLQTRVPNRMVLRQPDCNVTFD